MHEFFLLLNKISPLYFMVLLGYIGGKKLKVERDTIASILIYFISPIVVFNGVASAPQKASFLSLPLLTLSLACIISAIFYTVSKKIFSGSEKNLIGFMSGTGNTGYFGLPVILALFGTNMQNIAILATLGFVLFENTLGYFYIAKHSLSAKEALRKVLTLPALYAYAAGIIVNLIGYHPSQVIIDNITYFRGAYVVFGMFIIGVGLAGVTRASIDKKMIMVSFTAKFLAFPLTILLLRSINESLHFYDQETIHVLLVLSVVPIASNTVAFATKLKAHPEKAAFTVLLSTLFALIYIPVFVAYVLK